MKSVDIAQDTELPNTVREFSLEEMYVSGLHGKDLQRRPLRKNIPTRRQRFSDAPRMACLRTLTPRRPGRKTRTRRDKRTPHLQECRMCRQTRLRLAPPLNRIKPSLYFAPRLSNHHSSRPHPNVVEHHPCKTRIMIRLIPPRKNKADARSIANKASHVNFPYCRRLEELAAGFTCYTADIGSIKHPGFDKFLLLP